MVRGSQVPDIVVWVLDPTLVLRSGYLIGDIRDMPLA